MTTTTTRMSARRHGGTSVLLLLLLFAVFSAFADAQQPPPQQPPYNGWNTKFSPSMAIIIVVLISAFFFMGFFSIYIRQCGERAADPSAARPGGVAARSRRAAARGLDPAVIGTFPTLVYADVKEHKIGKGALECAVCLSEFEDEETLRLIPKCDHVFHPDCIDAWLASHTTCPVCRANLVPDPNAAPAAATSAVPVGSDGADPPAAVVPPVNSLGGDERRDEVAALPDHVAITIDDPIPDAADRTAADWRARIASKSRRMWRAKSMPRPLRFSRSHSTGHSVVQPGEDCERFTLRLPDQIRRDVLAGKLQRSSSCAAFPIATGEGSTRRGLRGGWGGGEGSSRGGGSVGGRSFKMGAKLEWAAKSDRWAFFTRTLSMISPRGGGGDVAEGSTRRGEGSTRRGAEATAGASEGSARGKVFSSVRGSFDCLSGGADAGGKADAAVDEEASTKALGVKP